MQVKQVAESQDQSSFWVIDSGCSKHMTGNPEMLTELKPLNGVEVRLADGSVIPAVGSGKLLLAGQKFQALFVPQLRLNLLSVAQLLHERCDAVFRAGERSFIQIGNKRVNILPHGKLLRLGDFPSPSDEIVNIAAEDATEADKQVLLSWHIRLGHPGISSLRSFLKKSGVWKPRMRLEIPFCDVCAQGKLSQRRFVHRQKYSGRVLERVYTDICGPFPTSANGHRYVLTVVDERSRKLDIAVLKSKDEASSALQTLLTRNMAALSEPISVVRSDGGAEFCSTEMKEFYASLGMIHEVVPPRSPELNGIAERVNRTLLERTRCLLLTSKLSHRLWHFAIQYATYLYNRLPHSALENNICPLKAFNPNGCHSDDLTEIYAFGSVGYCLLRESGKNKLETVAD